MGLQLGEIHRSSLESLELLGSLGCSDPRRSSWPGMTSWPATLGYGVGPSRVANDASSASNPTSRPPLTLVVVSVLSTAPTVLVVGWVSSASLGGGSRIV